MSVVFATNELYPLALPCAANGTYYTYNTGGHCLVMLMERPTSTEKQSVSRGPCEFGLVVDGPVIFFLSRFLPGVPWNDAPFSIHKEPQQQRMLPPLPEPEEQALLVVHLVNTANGMLVAQRAVTLGAEFTLVLHRAIQDQASQAWDEAAYHQHVNATYRRYPLPQDLSKKAVIKYSLRSVYAS
jgi:hypothetical protein